MEEDRISDLPLSNGKGGLLNHSSIYIKKGCQQKSGTLLPTNPILP